MSITVTAGTAPQFGWTSACDATRMWVQEVASAAILWDIAADDPLGGGAGTVTPPVTYGTVPGGTHYMSGPVPSPALVAGAQYRVVVTVHVESGVSRDYDVERTFTP